MKNNRNNQTMITVWEWTGIILFFYSAILIVSGIIYEPKIFSVNTSFLWGIFLMFFASALIYSGRKSRLKNILFILLLLQSSKAFSQDWEFSHPNPSVEGTGGLFRIVSPRAIGFKTFLIGSYFGFYNTPNDEVLVISRDYFALKERKEKVMFERFDSFGIYSYLFVGSGIPMFRVAGFLTGDISLTVRNSSVLVRQKMRGQELVEDNIQSFGDAIITPKVSYTLEDRYLSLGLWTKVYLLSKYRSPTIAAVSVAPGMSALFDFDELAYFRKLWKDIELFNPKVYASFSFNFDNSDKVIPSDIQQLFPSFVKTALLIENYNQFQAGFGIELGDSKKGIGRYISGFVEWYLYYYLPPPALASFSNMPQFISVGVRFKPIPLVSRLISPFPEEIKEASLFITTDIPISSSIAVPFEIGPTVYLRNTYPWAIFFGLNIYWNPWEKIPTIKEGGKIKFRVVDAENSTPLGDVIVSYPGFDLSNQSTDPSSGEVLSYELPVGEWEVNFRKPGYKPAAIKVQVEKGVIKEVEVAMEKEKGYAYVFGSVRSAADGSPIPAKIEVEGANIPPVFSKPADGSYEISLLPGRYKLKVSAEGFNPVDIDIKLISGDKKRYDIVLEPIKEIIERKGETLLKTPKRKITIEESTNSILLPEKILFDDKTNEPLPTSVELIEELAEFIKKELPDKKIIIEVHTSPIKSKEEDRIITQKRAEKIADLLAKYGVKKENLIPVGKGSDYPIAPNDTPEGRAKNRRVYFYIQQ